MYHQDKFWNEVAYLFEDVEFWEMTEDGEYLLQLNDPEPAIADQCRKMWAWN